MFVNRTHVRFVSRGFEDAISNWTRRLGVKLVLISGYLYEETYRAQQLHMVPLSATKIIPLTENWMILKFLLSIITATERTEGTAIQLQCSNIYHQYSNITG